MTLEKQLAKILIENKLTIATAESCTGGLLSSRLTDVSGSSEYTKLNFVTYANEAKNEILGVSWDILNTYGAVSEKCAEAMANGLQKKNRVRYSLMHYRNCRSYRRNQRKTGGVSLYFTKIQ